MLCPESPGRYMPVSNGQTIDILVITGYIDKRIICMKISRLDDPNGEIRIFGKCMRIVSGLYTDAVPSFFHLAASATPAVPPPFTRLSRITHKGIHDLPTMM